MSVGKFKQLVLASKFGKNDQLWFPRWIQRFASNTTTSRGRLLISQDGVINFCQQLLKTGTTAWQRWQAVRGIEAYRNLREKWADPVSHPP